MIQCFCSGLNSNCYNCGGMGYYEKVKLGLEGKIYVKKIEIKNQKIEIKKDLKIVERKQIKNPTPSEVINNPKIYGKDTFINLLKFLTEKLETLNKLNNGIEDLPQINLCKRNIKHVQDILVRNLYQAKTKKNKKKIEWLDIKINKSKKEKIKKNNKKNTQEIKNKKINKTANKKVERLSFLADVLGVEKKFNKKTTIGDIIKLGMVKPLKNK